MLVLQEGRAAILGGRRCFFSVVLPFMDCVEVMAVATMDLLLPWCPSASPHHGLERPLGGASSISRTVMRPVGRTLLGGGRGTGAPRSCATATSSTAARTTHTKASCGALMATWSPCSSWGTALDMPPPHRLLRSAVGRLPAHDSNGAACTDALARASSQGGGQDGRRMQGRRSRWSMAGGAGDEDPGTDGALFPRYLVPTRSMGKNARPPQTGGVGVAELVPWAISAATSTPLAREGVRTCCGAVGVADVSLASSSAATSTSSSASAAWPTARARNVDVTETILATGSAVTPTLREEYTGHFVACTSHSCVVDGGEM